SNCRRSSSDISLLPRFVTCHNPVIPAGPKKRNDHSSDVNSRASYNGSGRFPTSDISPFSTLTNWGNSSKLLLRKKEPNLVTLGSSLILINALDPFSEAY